MDVTMLPAKLRRVPLKLLTDTVSSLIPSSAHPLVRITSNFRAGRRVPSVTFVLVWRTITEPGGMFLYGCSANSSLLRQPAARRSPKLAKAHVDFMRPNDQKLSHAAGDSRQPEIRSENRPA